MDPALTKEILGACFKAKRVSEFMPDLPQGIKPRHVHVMDTLVLLRKEMKEVCISDISQFLNITMPSVTALINTMEEKRLIKKVPSSEDKRIIWITPTKNGEVFYNKYVKDFYEHLGVLFASISDEDARVMIQTVNSVYSLMKTDQEKKG